MSIERITSITRWTGRLTGSLSILVLLLFLAPEGRQSVVTPRQPVGLLFFPLGMACGLLIGWWREGLGGAIAVGSLLGFYLVYGLLLTGQVPGGPWFVVFTAPAIFLLGTWLFSRIDAGRIDAGGTLRWHGDNLGEKP